MSKKDSKNDRWNPAIDAKNAASRYLSGIDSATTIFPKSSGAARGVDLVCDHDGAACVWDGPRGITLHGARAAQAAEIDADILIDLSGTVSKIQGNALTGDPALVKALEKHTRTMRLLKIHWPDYKAPKTLHGAFWSALWNAIPDNNRVTICCIGSHGRTGTALASMILVDSATRNGVALDGYEATAIVRQRHCKKAVESREQERYLSRLASEVALAANLIDAKGADAMRKSSNSKFDAAFKSKPAVEVIGFGTHPGQSKLDLAPKHAATAQMFDTTPIDPLTLGSEFLRRDGTAPNGRTPLSRAFVRTLDIREPLTMQGIVEGDVFIDKGGDMMIAMFDDNGPLGFVGMDELDDADIALIEQMRDAKDTDTRLPGWADSDFSD